MSSRCSWFFVAILWSSFSNAEPQKYATLGDLHSASGEIISDTEIGYRTYGKIDSKKSNVLIMPTWHTGTTADLEAYKLIGPNKLLDTNHYFVVTIDALGNGVSTSPSNSRLQPDSEFPPVSTEDMVHTQYRLLTEKLGMQSVHAVIGISMGGMQAFQWIRQHPKFMKKAVAIDGSHYLTSYDVIQWQTHLNIIKALQKTGHSNRDIAPLLAPLNLLTLWTPEYFVENISRAELDDYLDKNASGSEGFDGYNYIAQTQAMINHNVFGYGTGLYERNVRSIATELLVVSVPGDHMVNPAPAKSLATLVGAAIIEINSNCGHMGTTCEDANVARQVNTFLRKQ